MVSKTVSSSPASPGQPLTYMVNVVNLGPETAVGVMVSDPLPPGTTFITCNAIPGTCQGPAVGSTGTVTANLGTIAVGRSAALTITVNVTASNGTLVNTATATSSTPDPDPGNNTSTAVTSVGAGIPMLSPPLLGLLTMMLAAAGFWFSRRQ